MSKLFAGKGDDIVSDKHLINIVVDKPIQFVRTLLEDKNSADLFLEIANYLIVSDPLLVVRTDCSTIGLSRPGERYLFYVAVGKDTLACKFKHWEKTKAYPSGSRQYYRSCCDEVVAYYAKHPEQFWIGVSTCLPRRSADIAASPIRAAEETQETIFPAAVKQEENPVRPERSCDTCFLRVSEQCSSLSNILCEDYRPGVFVSREEMELWPTGGDATTSIENFQERYYHNRST